MPNVTQRNFNDYWVYLTNTINALNYYYQIYQNQMVKKQEELSEAQLQFFKEQMSQICKIKAQYYSVLNSILSSRIDNPWIILEAFLNQVEDSIKRIKIT